MKKHQMNKLIIADHEVIRLVDPDDLLYCRADNGYSILYLRNGTKLTNCKSLTKIFEELVDFEKSDFIKVGQSYVVNTDCIKYINKKKRIILMENEEEVPFSFTLKELNRILGFEDGNLTGLGNVNSG